MSGPIRSQTSLVWAGNDENSTSERMRAPSLLSQSLLGERRRTRLKGEGGRAVSYILSLSYPTDRSSDPTGTRRGVAVCVRRSPLPAIRRASCLPACLISI